MKPTRRNFNMTTAAPDNQISSVRPASEPFWLPTSLLQETMSSKIAWRRWPFNIRIPFIPKKSLLASGNVVPSVAPLAEHPTVKFIHEIHNGVPPHETSLFRTSRNGTPVCRNVGWPKPKRKIPLDTDENFRLYYEKCRSMLDEFERIGLHPVSRLISPQDDVDIGIALIEKGVVHYRKGHHRLACARVLGLSRIPCQCYFVSERAAEAIKRRQKDHSLDWRSAAIIFLESLDDNQE